MAMDNKNLVNMYPPDGAVGMLRSKYISFTAAFNILYYGTFIEWCLIFPKVLDIIEAGFHESGGLTYISLNTG